ncbi:MAG TPA: HNH endonuclease [Acidimicrobiales bacterium]
MTRTRINPRSARTIAAAPQRDLVRAEVFERDGYRCLLYGRRDVPPCLGRLTVHHLRKSGQGGPYTPSNLVTLCSSHNDGFVEDQPDAAWELGLVCRNGETVDECWNRLRAAGLVR